MGHGFGVADTLFASHFGESWVYGVDMLGPNPGEALEPTLEGAKVLQVSRGVNLRVFVVLSRLSPSAAPRCEKERGGGVLASVTSAVVSLQIRLSPLCSPGFYVGCVSDTRAP